MKNCCILIILIMGKLDIINKVLNPTYKDNSNEMKEHSEEVVMDIKIVNRNNLKYALFRFCNLVYKADHFARVEGLQRMCDYFLFVEARNVLYVFIVELKSTSGSSRKISSIPIILPVTGTTAPILVHISPANLFLS